MSSSRPWRAAAFLGPFTGAPLLGRCSAKSQAGLSRFVARWQEFGATVVCWEVLPHPAIEKAALTQHAQSIAG